MLKCSYQWVLLFRTTERMLQTFLLCSQFLLWVVTMLVMFCICFKVFPVFFSLLCHWKYPSACALLTSYLDYWSLYLLTSHPLLFVPSIVTFQRLQLLLSYAVGGLLGDVFLHLLPEAWMYLGKGRFEVFCSCLVCNVSLQDWFRLISHFFWVKMCEIHNRYLIIVGWNM